MISIMIQPVHDLPREELVIYSPYIVSVLHHDVLEDNINDHYYIGSYENYIKVIR